jgi:inorganic pyrophosphatase
MIEPLSEGAVIALVVVPSVLALLYALVEYMSIKSIEVTCTGESASLMKNDTEENQKIVKKMVEIAGYIDEGATAFLMAEYKYMVVFIFIMSCLIMPFISPATGAAFIVGACASIICGYVGMKTAVMCNVRTTYACWSSLPQGFDLAVRGGSVMGLFLCGCGNLALFVMIVIFRAEGIFGNRTESTTALYEALAGFGLGGSAIALFGRVGGGIYTKAADVGADLAGKNEWGLDEDDPRNPACIADNVGDNVGDVAGMGADLFGSFAEATCAALIIAGASGDVDNNAAKAINMNFGAMMYPLILSSAGIIVSIITLFLCRKVIFKISDHVDSSVERALKGILIVSTLLATPCAFGLAFLCLPPSFRVEAGHMLSPMIVAVCYVVGLWAGLVIGFVTEYYTSHSYRPVREVAESDDVSAATGIIFGLALGYKSTIVPCLCLAIIICVAHTIAGMYGIALGALGMLGTLACAMSIDVYGPIADNAGGIAEMSGLGADIRERTDALDAAGNTTAAVGKGFAIGSAALVSLALFGAFAVRADIRSVDILNQWTFTGLLYGAMMPYWFSAMTMKSVGEAANDMVRECNRQFPLIMEGQPPEYANCVAISTEASLREMLGPGALVILSPIVFGFALGKYAVAGLLTGSLVSGVMLAISMSNSGGAWDNAKKYIEAGGLGEGKGKKSQAHKNAVIGDTVGDPLKDTSGPSLNIVVKLSAITALVFGGILKDMSNPEHGPRWLNQAAFSGDVPIF